MTVNIQDTLLPVRDVPIATVQSVDRQMTSGRNAPLLMTCARDVENGHDNTCQYVVKLFGDPELSKMRLARELFASLLACTLGLSTPEPAIIRIPDGFYSPIFTQRVARSAGLNFGSKLLTGMAIFNKFIPADMLQPAADIFAFDMLIQNLDRRQGNPNILTDKDRLMIFDHEMAFICASPGMWLGGAPEPWDVVQICPQNHALFPCLKHREISFDPFIARLQLVSDAVLDAITGWIPVDWRTEEIGLICKHIAKARDNAGRLMRALQEVIV